MRDLTEGGARLRFATMQAVPSQLTLILGRDRCAYRAEVIWRQLPEIGVEFTERVDLDAAKTAELRFLRQLWNELAAR